jgi:hypothetical protein
MKMEHTMEQRVNVKFCVKLQKSPSEMLEMLKTVSDDSTRSQCHVFKWLNRCREGREYVNDNERQGAPLTKQTDENVMKIRELA